MLVLALLVPALSLLFGRAVEERMGTIILSALVAHTGWHWMTERGEQLMQFSLPAVDAGWLASLIRWIMVLIAVAGVLWVGRRLAQGHVRLKPDEGSV